MPIFPISLMQTFNNILEKIVSYGIISNSGSKSSHNLFKHISWIIDLISQNNIVSLIINSPGDNNDFLKRFVENFVIPHFITLNMVNPFHKREI